MNEHSCLIEAKVVDKAVDHRQVALLCESQDVDWFVLLELLS